MLFHCDRPEERGNFVKFHFCSRKKTTEESTTLNMTSPPAKFRTSEGDWVCADTQCGNVNFARRTSCNRCGKEKSEAPKKKILGTEIGKAAAEKSGGLFSADDWQCSKCGNVNWARRQQCNMCNAPKYGEIEERTGYGGGYNERENVEYIERDESDGEYDEFGRKKKKFRGPSSSNHEDDSELDRRPNDSSDKKEKAHLDDEEEEEDDDDGDLSKYDLSGWGDDGEDNDAKNHNSTENNEKHSSNSHSTSGSPHRSSKSGLSRSRSPTTASSRNSGRQGSSRRSRSRSNSPENKSRRDHHKRSRSRSRDRFRSRSRSYSRSRSPIERRH